MAKDKEELIRKINICIILVMFGCLIAQIVALRLDINSVFYIFEYLFGFCFGFSLGFGIAGRILL